MGQFHLFFKSSYLQTPNIEKSSGKCSTPPTILIFIFICLRVEHLRLGMARAVRYTAFVIIWWSSSEMFETHICLKGKSRKLTCSHLPKLVHYKSKKYLKLPHYFKGLLPAGPPRLVLKKTITHFICKDFFLKSIPCFNKPVKNINVSHIKFCTRLLKMLS